MGICNEHPTNKLKLNSGNTWIRFNGLDINFNKGKIQAKKCRKIVVKRKLDLCKVNSDGLTTRDMEVQLQGKLKGTDEDQLCGKCYTYKGTTSEIPMTGIVTLSPNKATEGKNPKGRPIRER